VHARRFRIRQTDKALALQPKDCRTPHKFKTGSCSAQEAQEFPLNERQAYWIEGLGKVRCGCSAMDIQKRSESNVNHRAIEPPPGRRGARALQDLALAGGPPLTTRELARMIGMSSTFIRGEIRSGHLRAVPLGRGRKRVFRIPFREARRYVRELGLL
jgi:hypothetical protein